LAVLFAAVLQAGAQPVDPAACLPDSSMVGLARILDHALAQSPQMLMKNVELARADAAVLGAKAARLPSLGSNARYAYEDVSSRNSPGSMQKGFFYNVGLVQPLYHWGEISNSIEITVLERKIRERSWQEAYRELASNLRARYLALIMAKQSLIASRTAHTLREKARRNDEERHAAGLMSNTEYQYGAVQMEEASFALERENFEFDQACKGFARLAGLDEFREAEIPDDIPAPVVSEHQAERLVTWFEQSDRVSEIPSIQSLHYLLRQTELRYKVASVRLLPKLDMNLSDSQENNTYLNNGGVSQGATHRDSVGVSANWPLFDGFATRAAKRSALADRRDADLRIKGALEALKDTQTSLVTRFGFAVKGLAFADRRLAMAQGSLDFVTADVAAGRQSAAALDVARGAWATARYAQLAARSEVYARWTELLGLLWLDPRLQQLPSHLSQHGN
jgi:outer membrane protein TolC